MIRFGMYEYVRNIWFHLCIVFIMIIMMVITTVFLSNVDRQTRLYRLTEDYLDENSIFISFADAKLLEELKQVDKVLVAQTVSGYVEQNSEEKIISTAVYSEEVMKYIKPKVITIGMGLCASMGAFLLSSGDLRYALKHTKIMIHQPLGGVHGQATDVMIVAEDIIKTKQLLNEILSANTKQSLKKIAKDVERDYYMDALESLAYGLIDEILNTNHHSNQDN